MISNWFYLKKPLGRLAILSFALFILSGFFSNSDDDDGVLVVQIENLDPYKYGDIYKAFKDHPLVNLSEACVPADILKFEIKDGVDVTEDVLFNTIKIIIQEATDIDLIIFTDHDSESFQQLCLDARVGN